MERSINSVLSDLRPMEEDDWNVHGYIEVPNSLDRCTQDCDGDFIKVKHRYVRHVILANASIKFVIGLRNPDGHVSEIRASLPCALVLPPDISSTGITPHLDDSTVNHLSYLDSSDILPSYESRIYDRLWDGVSYGDLDISVLNTPTTISRPTSAENLQELNQTTLPHPGDIEAGLHQALQERNAEDAESSHDTSSENSNVLASTSGPTNSAPIMRPQNSQQSAHTTDTTSLNGDDEDIRLTPISSPEMQNISRTPSNGSSRGSSHSVATSASEDYIDMGRLSRVPSYSTANSSVLNLHPINTGLPTYSLATSNLPTIPEQSRSPSESVTSRRSSSSTPEARVRRTSTVAVGVSTSDTASGFRNDARIRSVYGVPQRFDDPMKRISLMRMFFSSR